MTAFVGAEPAEAVFFYQTGDPECPDPEFTVADTATTTRDEITSSAAPPTSPSNAPPSDSRCRKQLRSQLPNRHRESRLRRERVKLAQAMRRRGVLARDVAFEFDMSDRTLRYWQQHQHDLPAPRGRPCKACALDDRQAVLAYLRECGPTIRLKAVRQRFPRIARCVLEDLLRRYRKVWRKQHPEKHHTLEWLRAGSVWAIDFSEANAPIDGAYEYIFTVRDLASGLHLAWVPVLAETAAEATRVLVELIREHGAPLVLKSDNGSAFIAASFQECLVSHGVTPLPSPEYYPAYNGAVERANQTLKSFTAQHAERAGHPLRWTSEDLEHARRLANSTPRDENGTGPTPNELWRDRAPITEGDRFAFQLAVDLALLTARADLGYPIGPLPRRAHGRVQRLALTRVMTDQGYLTITTRLRPGALPERRASNAPAHRRGRGSPSQCKPDFEVSNSPGQDPRASYARPLADDNMHPTTCAGHAVTEKSIVLAIGSADRSYITSAGPLTNTEKTMLAESTPSVTMHLNSGVEDAFTAHSAPCPLTLSGQVLQG